MKRRHLACGQNDAFFAPKSLCFTSAVKKTADGNEEMYFFVVFYFLFKPISRYINRLFEMSISQPYPL